MSLVEVQVTCIRRYAKELDDIPIFLATEMNSSSPLVERILRLHNIHHILLQKHESEFLESRVAAVKYIPPEYEFILPLQEDFWLDRRPDLISLNEAIVILHSDKKVKSVRLMPSPGPHISDIVYNGRWKILSEADEYKFTFQATMWRSSVYLNFLEEIIRTARYTFDSSNLSNTQWSKYCVSINVAENYNGQKVFSDTSMNADSIHLSIDREHRGQNAVYMAPWPYRPTAVVRGKLEPWAKEFALREGFTTVEGWF